MPLATEDVAHVVEDGPVPYLKGGYKVFLLRVGTMHFIMKQYELREKLQELHLHFKEEVKYRTYCNRMPKIDDSPSCIVLQ